MAKATQKNETRRKVIATCGVLIVIGVALLIAAFMSKKDVTHPDYGNTVVSSQSQ